MVFSSHVFLFLFLPAVLLCYYIAPRRWRNPVLLCFSLLFYAWGEPRYLAVMLFVILVNYLGALAVARQKERGRGAGAALALTLALNLATLFYFKYTAFFLRSLQAALPVFSELSIPRIVLPIGISFYIFQSMSYTIDVYRAAVEPQRNLLDFGTYVSLFPQLIAGPIVRYRDVADQLRQRRESLSGFAAGVGLFVIGLGKKLLLANPMGALWEALQQQPGTAAAWMGMAAYTLQLYFDFSGYSDMACGLGRMFGFEFLPNFRYPYVSESVTEFWRRWHISLSAWFREYVYIPLGGNRRGLSRQILNLAIVWALTGLWHGASWNFVLWGLYYAVLLIAEKLFLLRLGAKLPRLLRHILLLLAVSVGWMLFYFEDLAALGAFLTRLVTPAPSGGYAADLMLSYLPMLLAAAFAATPAAAKLYERVRGRSWAPWLRLGGLALVFLLCVAALASQSYNPFIYFRF